MTRSLDLLQANIEKICHDLAGPIGIVNSCLGLMDDDDQSISENAKQLVIEQSENLVKTIRFIRAIYSSNQKKSEIKLNYAIVIIKEQFLGSSIKFITDIKPPIESNINNILFQTIISLISIILFKNRVIKLVELNISKNFENIKITADIKPKQNQKYSNILDSNVDKVLSIQNCREFYAKELCKKIGYTLLSVKNSKIFEYLITKQ